ncbi:MAG: hypothetical protein QXW80_03945 [Candidatus Micrarchaeia archaeon]
MMIGYIDKNKHFGIDDHVTVLFNIYEVKSMHGKVIDQDTIVYMKYDVNYFSSPDGIKKLLQDMQKRNDISFRVKMVLLLIYQIVKWVFDRGCYSRDLRILKNSEARNLGMRSPCIYIKPVGTEKILLPIYNWIICWQSYILKRKFGKRTSITFKEQSFPGVRITKRPKRRS